MISLETSVQTENNITVDKEKSLGVQKAVIRGILIVSTLEIKIFSPLENSPNLYQGRNVFTRTLKSNSLWLILVKNSYEKKAIPEAKLGVFPSHLPNLFYARSEKNRVRYIYSLTRALKEINSRSLNWNKKVRPTLLERLTSSIQRVFDIEEALRKILPPARSFQNK